VNICSPGEVTPGVVHAAMEIVEGEIPMTFVPKVGIVGRIGLVAPGGVAVTIHVVDDRSGSCRRGCRTEAADRQHDASCQHSDFPSEVHAGPLSLNALRNGTA
jgi:hypothetical protein